VDKAHGAHIKQHSGKAHSWAKAYLEWQQSFAKTIIDKATSITRKELEDAERDCATFEEELRQQLKTEGKYHKATPIPPICSKGKGIPIIGGKDGAKGGGKSGGKKGSAPAVSENIVGHDSGVEDVDDDDDDPQTFWASDDAGEDYYDDDRYDDYTDYDDDDTEQGFDGGEQKVMTHTMPAKGGDSSGGAGGGSSGGGGGGDSGKKPPKPWKKGSPSADAEADLKKLRRFKREVMDKLEEETRKFDLKGIMINKGSGGKKAGKKPGPGSGPGVGSRS
jgi:hypothetical protein